MKFRIRAWSPTEANVVHLHIGLKCPPCELRAVHQSDLKWKYAGTLSDGLKLITILVPRGKQKEIGAGAEVGVDSGECHESIFEAKVSKQRRVQRGGVALGDGQQRHKKIQPNFAASKVQSGC